MTGKGYYITTPIYYVNDKPHIGHAYTTIAADILNRYHHGLGRDTFFLTGTDEHGQKVQKAAEARGVDPQQHCDEMAPRFQDLWKFLNVEPSGFVRTTNEKHLEIVQETLRDLYERELIVSRNFEGWYCTPCERFWTEKDLVDGKCPDCHRPVELLTEKAYFFLMSRFRDEIRKVIEDGTMKILPVSRRNEILAFLDKDLGDLCISRPRTRLSWGVPLPFDKDFVAYVWFDALLNYISGPTFLDDSASALQRWPADIHLIGKDILTTHAVYWPAMLLAMGKPLPREIFAHGWWNFSGEKMSKSVGNVVDPRELVEAYRPEQHAAAVDAFRYFLFSEAVFGQDGTFSIEAFERRWTAELANDLGNLISRVCSLSWKVLGGEVPSQRVEDEETIVNRYREHIEQYRFHKALEEVMGLVRSTNQEIQNSAPWANPECAPEVLGRAVRVLRLSSVLLAPFTPDAASRLAKALGLEAVPPMADALDDFTARPEKKILLFPRPERDKKKSTEKESEKKMAEEAKPAEDEITIKDFAKVKLRTGRIEKAERVEGADKLLLLSVNTGEKIRTLVAGLAEGYSPEELLGKDVIVVANLKPAKIRGIVSDGMILAATPAEGGQPVIVTPERPFDPGGTVR